MPVWQSHKHLWIRHGIHISGWVTPHAIHIFWARGRCSIVPFTPVWEIAYISLNKSWYIYLWMSRINESHENWMSHVTQIKCSLGESRHTNHIFSRRVTYVIQITDPETCTSQLIQKYTYLMSYLRICMHTLVYTPLDESHTSHKSHTYFSISHDTHISGWVASANHIFPGWVTSHKSHFL